MLLRLGPRYLLSDSSPSGVPGRAYDSPGWGVPRWGPARVAAGFAGPMKPVPIGARYYCGDCGDGTEAVAWGHKYGATKDAYQEAITAHYTEDHKDLHYPLPQDDLDRMHKAKAKMMALEVLAKDLKDLKEWSPQGVGGGTDLSGEYLRVERPRELPDFTEFDFPDANVADAGTEEIELDQLISIQARQGRRFLGVELENLDNELAVEMITLTADNVLSAGLQLNTRAGTHHLDDPENIWRANLFQTINITEGSSMGPLWSINNPPPGGSVYVAPRLFLRFENNLDRQVDIGDLFIRIATVAQPLSTFLLFELLEQFSGLFGLT